MFSFYFSGVSFTSRQFSRIRLHEAEPGGNYFVMVEAMQNIRNLTLEIKLIGTTLKWRKFARFERTALRNQYVNNLASFGFSKKVMLRFNRPISVNILRCFKNGLFQHQSCLKVKDLNPRRLLCNWAGPDWQSYCKDNRFWVYILKLLYVQ